MDSELEFAIQPNTTGKQLFDQVRSVILVQFVRNKSLYGSNLICRLLFPHVRTNIWRVRLLD